MNIIAIWLVIVGTKSGLVVMCKILTAVVVFFIYAHVNSTFLGCDSLPLVLIINLFIMQILKDLSVFLQKVSKITVSICM